MRMAIVAQQEKMKAVVRGRSHRAVVVEAMNAELIES
jgi:hypothetical protein